MDYQHELILFFEENGNLTNYVEIGQTLQLFTKEPQIGLQYQNFLLSCLVAQLDEAKKVYKEKPYFRFEYLHPKTKSWLQVQCSFKINAAHAPYQFVLTILDISYQKSQQKLLKGLLDSSFAGIVRLESVRDDQDKIVDFEWVLYNHTAEQLIEQNSFKVINKSLLQTLPSPQGKALCDQYVKVVEKGISLDFETVFTMPDYPARCFRLVAVKHEDGLVVSFEDITRKKNREEELLKLKRQYEQVFNGTQDAMFLIEVTNETHFTFQTNNLSHQQKTGLAAAYIQGKTAAEFLPASVSQEVEQNYLRCVHEKKAISYEETLHLPAGQRTWHTTLSPVLKEDKVVFIVGSATDITERKKAEKALRQNELKYRMLAENAADLIFLTNSHGILEYVNSSVQPILGYTPEELTGKSVFDFLDPVEIEPIKTRIRLMASQGITNRQVEQKVKTRNGDYIWLSNSITTITDDQGKLVSIQAISRDDTQKVNLLQNLEQQNAHKDRLFSLISHDLRNPMSNYLNLTELLGNQVSQMAPGNTGLKKTTTLLRRNASKMSALLNELLTWSLQQLNQVRFVPEEFNLQELAEAIADDMADLASEKALNIFVKIEQSIRLCADKHMLEAILRNLIVNSIKFTPNEGCITLSANIYDLETRISVSDNGIGMKEEDRQKLLQKNSFFTTMGTKGEKGTGLGLNLCKSFIEKHGGRLCIKSKPGTGSSFTFNIPHLIPGCN